MNLDLNTAKPKSPQMKRAMAKFIEVKQSCKVLRRVQGEDVYEYVEEPIFINKDYIETIIPQGDSCIITLHGNEPHSITVHHSALWVIGLINGNQ